MEKERKGGKGDRAGKREGSRVGKGDSEEKETRRMRVRMMKDRIRKRGRRRKMEGKERKREQEKEKQRRELVFDHGVSGPDSILGTNLPPPTSSRAGAEKGDLLPIPAHFVHSAVHIPTAIAPMSVCP